LVAEDDEALGAVLARGLREQGYVGLPRFAVSSLHRNLSLLGLAFVVVHVLNADDNSYGAAELTPQARRR
jgi:hypothetical protein